MPEEEQITNLLIVEDDVSIRGALSNYLKYKGFRVDNASNGMEALSLIKEQTYDAVISDIIMPEMNGLEFLEEAKLIKPELIVVLITGYADMKVAIEAMKKGASDFITKPFQLDHVEQILKGLLRGTHLKTAESEDSTAHVEEAGEEASKDQYTKITDLNQKLEKKIRELSILYSISESMNDTGSEDDIFNVLTEMATKITGAQSAVFHIYDRDSERLFAKSYSGSTPPPCYLKPVTINKMLMTRILESVDPVMIQSKKAFHFCEYEGQGEPCEVFSLLTSTLDVRGEIFGVLSLFNKQGVPSFTSNDSNFVKILLSKAALNIENTALYETLYNNLVNTLNSLVSTIEAKDPYTQKHSERVTEFSIGIAKTMACSYQDIEAIQFAARLHDIGKIGISDAILQKDGPLTDEEYEIIKSHPNIGVRILDPIGMLPHEKAIIKHHHERWDGRGYPDGLKGKEIPFLARIVSLADAYDAMTSDRVYRKALSHKQAIREIVRNVDFQFDGRVVKAFLKYAAENPLELEVSQETAPPSQY